VLISEISGETPRGSGDELQLTEDLHLDSLGRVQLAAALEERTGVATGNGEWEQVQTLGDLRRLLASGFDVSEDGGQTRTAPADRVDPILPLRSADWAMQRAPQAAVADPAELQSVSGAAQGLPRGIDFRNEIAELYAPSTSSPTKAIYPHWPWWAPFRWLRVAFIEAVMRPLVWVLSKPRVEGGNLQEHEPMLMIANHVTSFDGPLLEYALPAAIRKRMAVAMSGEMLEDYRRFRNPQRAAGKNSFYLPGPLIYALLTAFFNVFPLPRQRDFQRSFAHAGEALDRGMHVLLFPEGTRSADGRLAKFRPGIGLLVKQSSAPVLPMAIRGLGELKAGGRGWFRSGTIEVLVGRLMRFSPAESESSITAKLHAAVEELLGT